VDQNSDHQLNQPGFKSLISLAQESKVIVKISGLYRASTRDEKGFDDLQPIIKVLAATIPDRLVWASDWPHTGEGKDRKNRNLDDIEDFRPVDNEAILKNVREWMGDEGAWVKMMVDTPAMVYR
jgi:predicted TIM-barrel fold metal-dependent hydrolase